jgi:hypothetical protein
MNAAAEDRWTDVLAGRAAPHDADTRRAARARAWFEARARADLDTPPDEAATARLLVRLEQAAAGLRPGAPEAGAPALPASRLLPGAEGGRGEDRVPARPAPRPGGPQGWAAWRALLDTWLTAWLAARHLAAFAAALFGGVLVLQWWVVHDEASDIKTAPPAASAPAPGSYGHTLIAASATPLQDAMALREELRALGVTAQVLELGDATRVQAAIDPAAQAAVRQTLSQKGWAWTPGPQLSVEFQRKP